MDWIHDRHGTKNACKIFMEKPETTRLNNLGIDGRITKVCLKEIGWTGDEWIHLVQGRDQK